MKKKNDLFRKKTYEYELSIGDQENNELKEAATYHHVHANFLEYHLIIDHPT
jgi:hypothetical protein